MTTQTQNALEQQRERRKRVNRIKNSIIITISVWMVLSLLAIIFLTFSVIHLGSKVRLLENKVALMEQQVEQQKQDTSLIGEQSQESFEMSTMDPYANVIRGIDTPENMASEEDEHYVYLTFDSEVGENTLALLDELKENNILATFFVSGCEDESLIPIYQRIVQDGHTIGMHSYSNQYSTIYASCESFYNDYKKMKDFFTEKCGINSNYYRFPGGSGNEISNDDMAEYVHILNQENMIFYDWNVSAGDAVADYSTEDVITNVMNGVTKYKTSVVLLHDGPDKSTTVNSLKALVERLNEIDAHVLPIDENTDVIQYIKADSVE